MSIPGGWIFEAVQRAVSPIHGEGLADNFIESCRLRTGGHGSPFRCGRRGSWAVWLTCAGRTWRANRPATRVFGCDENLIPPTQLTMSRITDMAMITVISDMIG